MASSSLKNDIKRGFCHLALHVCLTSTLSSTDNFLSCSNSPFLTLYSLCSSSSFVGSACKWTSAPFSYASQANTV